MMTDSIQDIDTFIRSQREKLTRDRYDQQGYSNVNSYFI
jgi:hypothetical protein